MWQSVDWSYPKRVWCGVGEGTPPTDSDFVCGIYFSREHVGPSERTRRAELRAAAAAAYASFFGSADGGTQDERHVVQYGHGLHLSRLQR